MGNVNKRDNHYVCCPYYKKNGRQTITCEGPVDGVNTQLNFCRDADRITYMQEVCRQVRGWHRCAIASVAGIKYRT